MSRQERAQGHGGTGQGSRVRTIRLAIFLAAVVITFYFGSFFFLAGR